MQTTARHRLRLAATSLWLVWLAACTSTPVAVGDGTAPVVLRTPNATVWATPEAALAAAAPTAAPARPADARPVAASGVGTAGSAGSARGANAAGASGAAGAGAGATQTASAAPGGPRASASPESSAAAAAVLAQTLYFDFDRFGIKEEFRPLLEGHAQVLMADRSVRLVIEGHADERGGAEYNLALGQKRAQAVAKALALLGVADSQVEAVSFGDTRPVVPDSTEAAWARNRRAEIKRR